MQTPTSQLHNQCQDEQSAAQSNSDSEQSTGERGQKAEKKERSTTPNQWSGRRTDRRTGMDAEERRIGQRVFKQRLGDQSAESQAGAHRQGGNQARQTIVQNNRALGFRSFAAEECCHDIADRNLDTAATQTRNNESQAGNKQEQRKTETMKTSHSAMGWWRNWTDLPHTKSGSYGTTGFQAQSFPLMRKRLNAKA